MKKYRTNIAIAIMLIYGVGMALSPMVHPYLINTFKFWFSVGYTAIGVAYSAYIGFKKNLIEPNDEWKELVQWTSLLASFFIPLLFIIENTN